MTCSDCRFFHEGRCLRFPPFIGSRPVPVLPSNGQSWCCDDHPLVDPDQPVCGEYKH